MTRTPASYPTPSPGPRCSGSSTTAQAAEARLAGLSRAERDVLLLVARADLGHQEVAEALSVPVGTVCSRLSRAAAGGRPLPDHARLAPAHRRLLDEIGERPRRGRAGRRTGAESTAPSATRTGSATACRCCSTRSPSPRRRPQACERARTTGVVRAPSGAQLRLELPGRSASTTW
ncbi:RNA polymerase sigma factor [Streptomyces asoensis]|uniref:RNA polymerase sigma factor n=1 Tax=Streptomyces asoensis TaxID=249586 RepID=UPI003F4CF9AA